MRKVSWEIETLVLRPAEFRKKIDTQGGDKYCKAMHLNNHQADISQVATYIFKSIRYFLKKCLNTTKIVRDLVVTKHTSDILGEQQ